jgi:ADP-ribose pyrophosphatase YjhB (NUDIX family)
MLSFTDVAALARWLDENGIDTDSWGVGETKSVANLWDELMNGDCRLQAAPPLRLLEVAQIIIRRGEQILIEVEQEFHNGQRRMRHLLPAEKMQAGEDYRMAALRGLQEELGVAEANVVLLPHYKRLQTTIDSPSYPGLRTQYIFHQVEAAVTGLPEGDFWRENSVQTHGDPVKRQRWAWQQRSDLLSL